LKIEVDFVSIHLGPRPTYSVLETAS